MSLWNENQSKKKKKIPTNYLQNFMLSNQNHCESMTKPKLINILI